MVTTDAAPDPLDRLRSVLSRADQTPNGPATLAEVESAVNDVGAVFGAALREVRAANTVLAARVATLESALEDARRHKPRISVRAGVGARFEPAPTTEAEQ